jgi:vesicle transport through interaction with t-SNAREs protein 1
LDEDDDDLEAITRDQRQRLLMSTQIVDESSERLARAHRTALETEEIGMETLNTLEQQKETLKRAYDKVFDVNDKLDSGRRVLIGMSRRALTNKLLLVLLIIALIFGIAAIVYLRWIKRIIK